jgi:hypothetical protein
MGDEKRRLFLAENALCCKLRGLLTLAIPQQEGVAMSADIPALYALLNKEISSHTNDLNSDVKVFTFCYYTPLTTILIKIESILYQFICLTSVLSCLFVSVVAALYRHVFLVTVSFQKEETVIRSGRSPYYPGCG